jgi:hypothetical protein
MGKFGAAKFADDWSQSGYCGSDSKVVSTLQIACHKDTTANPHGSSVTPPAGLILSIK